MVVEPCSSVLHFVGKLEVRLVAAFAVELAGAMAAATVVAPAVAPG